jgi:uncharacterized membrane protein YozB (DUF420 family)
MKKKYTLEIVFLLMVIAVSLVGFSTLLLGEEPTLTAYHYLHVITSLAWLLLMLSQLFLLRQNDFRRHRAIGKWIFVAGPLLIASLTLLSVHSASKEAAAGGADDLLIQNVGTTIEVALLVFLAFILRRNRDLHGSFMMSTSVPFMGVAMFFTFISYVPRFKIDGPETFSRFAEAGQAISLFLLIVGLLFFLRKWRTGWPWILASVFFTVNGMLQGVLDGAGRTKALTALVASVGRAPAFALSLLGFAALLWVAWKVGAPKRAARPLVAEATSA